MGRKIWSLVLVVLLVLPLGVSAEGWTSRWQQDPPVVEVESVGRTQVVLRQIRGGYGDVEYAWGFTEDGPDTEWTTKRVFMDLTPGETYYFFARYSGNEEFAPSEQSEPERVIMEQEFQQMEGVTVRDVTKEYDGNPAEVDVTIPRGANIYYREGTSGSYDLSIFPEYTDVGTYQVDYLVELGGYADMIGTVTVKIVPAVPTVTLVDKTVDYTGKSQEMDGARVRFSGGLTYKGTVVYTYYTNSACTQGETTQAPTEPGTYYVVAAVPAGENYGEASSLPAKLVIRDRSGSSPTEGTTAPTAAAGITYTITATCGEGGKLEPSGSVPAPKGKNVSFSARPEKGYVVDDIKVDGVSMGSVAVYTFRNIQGDHTLEISFRRTVAETTAPAETTEEATTQPAETTQPPTTQQTAPATERPQQKPEKKSIPIMIPILLVVLAFGAIGIGVYVYQNYDED